MKNEISSVYETFSTNSNGDDIFLYAKSEREKILKTMREEGSLQREIQTNLESYLKEDDSRIQDTMQYRLDPTKKALGVHGKHETKSMVMENNDKIYYFIMPGDTNLDNDIVASLGLSVAKLNKYGIIPYTVNPATVMSLGDKSGKPVSVFIHKDLDEPEFLCNNLGSKFLSYTVSKDHSRKPIETLALEKGIEVKRYDGSFGDFIEKSGIDLPQKSFNPKPTLPSQLMGGDYQKSDGSGRFNW